MKTGKITLGKNKISVAYCFATEINFFNFSNKLLDNISKDGNPTDIVYLILSAIIAHDEFSGENQGITDKQLIYESNPEQLVKATEVILALRKEWYASANREDKKSTGEKKNHKPD